MNSKKTGFTLIELLIATFVLTMAILGILSLFPLGIKVENSSQLSSVANELAQGKIEEMISKSYDELTNGTQTEAYGQVPGFPQYKRITEISCYDSNGSSLPNCPDTEIKQIKVSLYWRSQFGVAEKNISLITLMVKK